MRDPFEELAVPGPADRFPAEARRAARSYLASRRTLLWTPVVFVALLLVSGLTSPSWLSSITMGLAFSPAVAGGIAWGKLTSAASWLRSLRAITGYAPVPADVRMTRYARSVLAGETVAGELETALLAVWNGDQAAVEQARPVLARRGVPDVSSDDYESPADAAFPTWHRHGRPAWEAPLPDAEHTCTGWTVAVTEQGTEKTTVVQRCACGAINLDAQNFWEDRNSSRRKEATQEP